MYQSALKRPEPSFFQVLFSFSLRVSWREVLFLLLFSFFEAWKVILCAFSPLWVAAGSDLRSKLHLFITKLINIQKRKLFAAELPVKIAGNPTSQDLSQDVEEQDLNISPVCCCCFRTCQICHIYYRNWMEIWSDADVDNTVYFVLDANSQTKPNECQDSFSSFFCELDRCTKMIEHL